MPGGTFKRRYDGINDIVYGGWDLTDPSYLAAVSGFYLDKYEVTVGRCRRFVEAVTLDGWRPEAGSGVTERQCFVGRVRALARQVAEAWMAQREAAGFPLLKGERDAAE